MNIEKIREHYEHAKAKHPYFCDGILPCDIPGDQSRNEVREIIATNLRLSRDRLEVGGKIKNLLWNEILNCEVWEFYEAFFKEEKDAAIEEVYDVIAVLLRVVDVLEGRQALGKPKKKGGAE